MRVGLFGGTFNPIHLGHTQAADQVRRRFHLDCVHFIPCAVPPHKEQGPLAPAADRLEMARCALGKNERLKVSDIEIQRPGPSYTIDTLRCFRTGSTPDQRLFFLLGLDAFLELHTWKSYQLVLEATSLIIMPRPMRDGEPPDMVDMVQVYVRRHLSADYRPSEDGSVMRHPVKCPLYLSRGTPVDIASRRVRAAIGRGDPIEEWVAPAVARYIASKGLYR